MNFPHCVAAFMQAALCTTKGVAVRRERLRTAPGQCADCGDDAYILLAGSDELVCAHCFALRRAPADKDAAPSTNVIPVTAQPARPRRSGLRAAPQHSA